MSSDDISYTIETFKDKIKNKMKVDFFKSMSLKELLWDSWKENLINQENWHWKTISSITIFKSHTNNILQFPPSPHRESNDNKEV